MPGDAPLVVLLLPERLEAFAARELAEDLLRAPGAVAVDPARLSYAAVGRLGGVLAAAIGAAQARRLLRALPGTPRAFVIFDPLQLPLADALLDRLRDAELWYGSAAASGEERPLRPRLRRLEEEAELRCDLRFAAPETLAEPVRALTTPLLERMEALGVESGRLGSERARAPAGLKP